MLLSTLKTTEGALPRVPCLTGQWVTVAILSKEDNETADSSAELRFLQPKLADFPEKARREHEELRTLVLGSVHAAHTVSPHKVREESVSCPNQVQVETVSAVRGETQKEPFPAHMQLYRVRTPRAVSTVKKRSKHQRSKGFGRWMDDEHTAARQPEYGGTSTSDGWLLV